MAIVRMANIKYNTEMRTMQMRWTCRAPGLYVQSIDQHDLSSIYGLIIRGSIIIIIIMIIVPILSLLFEPQ